MLSFDGIPRPVPGTLTAYFLGPGFGESIVVVFPDERCMVVDACYQDNENATLALLDKVIRSRSIDLLVLTHPDRDHLRGAADLLPTTTRLWSWPHHGSVRRLASIASANAKGKIYHDLYLLLEQLNQKIRNGLRTGGGGVGMPQWPEDPGATYHVVSMGPSSYDENSAGVELDRLVEDRLKTGWPSTQALLDGILTSGQAGDRPNRLSKAVVIEWGVHRLLLAGDVENRGNPKSGWGGIIAELLPEGNEPDRQHLLQNLTLVKVAHHGSAGAFSQEAWNLHCSAGKVHCGVLAPFNLGTNPPPDQATLAQLRGHINTLTITSASGKAGAAAIAAGWTSVHCSRATGSASVAALTLNADGTWTWCLSGQALLYR